MALRHIIACYTASSVIRIAERLLLVVLSSNQWEWDYHIRATDISDIIMGIKVHYVMNARQTVYILYRLTHRHVCILKSIQMKKRKGYFLTIICHRRLHMITDDYS